MALRKQASTFILERLANFSSAAEGATLPPQISKGNRVNFVSRLTLIKIETGTNVNKFYLSFIEPSRGDIRNYNIYYEFKDEGVMTGPISCLNSPAVLTIPTAANRRITFFAQTVLTSGMSSTPENSPTCSAITI